LSAKTPQGRKQWLVEHLGKGADSRSSLMAVLPTREDRAALQRIIGPCRWELRWTGTCREAIDVFRRARPAIVICDRDLADGDWRQLWDILGRAPKPPMFIVTSRLADDALWAEVLNVGGYDLLLKLIPRRRSNPHGACCCDGTPVGKADPSRLRQECR